MVTLQNAMLLLGLLGGMSQGPSLAIRDPRALMKISDYVEFRNAAADLRTLSEVRKIMLVDALRDMLADNRKVRLDGYAFQAGQPDLRVVAGRAEWFIDQIVLLPREAENSMRHMDERIDMWKASAASLRTTTPDQIEMLKTKYRGKIRNGIFRKAFESIQNFEKFLEDWFPYGKSVKDMEGILGIKLPIEGDEAVLHMQSGIGGTEFRFVHNNGTIRVVKQTPLL
jgi:hypothetical protein